MKPKYLELHSVEAAPRLLGWILCRQLPEGLVKVRLVETEAYHQDDPASHSFKGITKRTAPMFEAGGTIYVYFTYGMHYCLNLVTGPKGKGEGVLLRAAEPLEGLEIMSKNRQQSTLKSLTNGPGKLAQALGIFNTELSGKKLGKNTLWLEPPIELVTPSQIAAGPRIGISQAVEVEARFYLRDNSFVSKR